MKILIALLLLIPLGSSAYDFTPKNWTQEDTTFEAIYVVVTLIDMKTTLDIKNHEELNETNVFMGTNPSDEQIYTYFAGAILTQYLIAAWMPQKFRGVWQGFTFGIEANDIDSNLKLGLKIKF